MDFRRKIIVLTLMVLAASTLILTSCGQSHEHKWSEWEPYIDATCYVAGQEKSTCECGEVRYREIPVTHDFVYVEKDIAHGKTVYQCSICGTKKEEKITYEDLGMPIVFFDGSLDGISTKNRVTVDVSYESAESSFNAKASLKVQGATSANYPKKNYSVKFLDEDGDKLKITIRDEWGAHSKYCLKANYIDYSQARNVVSAKLYGQIAKTRAKDDVISTLTNGGAIDGFPCAVYLNGEFLGLYTFNTPKDEYVLGMNAEDAHQAMLMAASYTDQTKLRAPIEGAVDGSGFEIEYCSTEDTEGAGWVTESFNAVIAFLNENDGVAFREGLPEYVDVERAIDQMLLIYAIDASDNKAKNTMWVTYDGKLWIPSPYDLDSTFGLEWNGESFNEPGAVEPGYPYNVLWEKLNLYFADEVRERWAQLRSGPLSVDNIRATFDAFLSLIPDDVRAAESARWPEVAIKDGNNIDQIMEHANSTLYQIDVYYGLQ